MHVGKMDWLQETNQWLEGKRITTFFEKKKLKLTRVKMSKYKKSEFFYFSYFWKTREKIFGAIL